MNPPSRQNPTSNPTAHAVDAKGMTELMHACHEGDEDRVKTWIEAGSEVDARDKDGNTALMHAVMCNRPQLVLTLVQAGADVDKRDKDGKTALTLAIGCDHSRCAQILLDVGADVHARDKDGNTTLVRAVMQNKPQYVLNLVKAGANVDAKSGGGDTPLMLAASSANVHTMKRLIEAGADVNKTSSNGYSPIHCAIDSINGNPNVECVKELITAKCNLEATATCWGGFTALGLAAFHGLPNIMKVLINAGAKVDKVDAGAQTALMTAVENSAEMPHKLQCVEVLIDAGANLDATVYGKTALMVAKRYGHKECFQALIKAKANQCTETASSSSPLPNNAELPPSKKRRT